MRPAQENTFQELIPKIIREKQKCGSSCKESALQGQSSEFKPKPHQKQQKTPSSFRERITRALIFHYKLHHNRSITIIFKDLLRS
jgi:hypothetical protein